MAEEWRSPSFVKYSPIHAPFMFHSLEITEIAWQSAKIVNTHTILHTKLFETGSSWHLTTTRCWWKNVENRRVVVCIFCKSPNGKWSNVMFRHNNRYPIQSCSALALGEMKLEQPYFYQIHVTFYTLIFIWVCIWFVIYVQLIHFANDFVSENWRIFGCSSRCSR